MAGDVGARVGIWDGATHDSALIAPPFRPWPADCSEALAPLQKVLHLPEECSLWWTSWFVQHRESRLVRFPSHNAHKQIPALDEEEIYS